MVRLYAYFRDGAIVCLVFTRPPGVLAAAGVHAGDATTAATSAGERSNDGGGATHVWVRDVASQRHARTDDGRQPTTQEPNSDELVGRHANSEEVSGRSGFGLVLVMYLKD